MRYKAFVCGKVIVKNSSADLYFTSDKSNTDLLKLRILDADGNIVSETGLIEPGQYVKSVKFNKDLKDGDIIQLKIMGYEKDTYISDGSVTLNTTVTKGE